MGGSKPALSVGAQDSERLVEIMTDEGGEHRVGANEANAG